MASPIKISLLLADYAQQDQSGKVSMLGAGWSNTFSPLPPHAVVALIQVPWDRTNQTIPFALRLLTDDGEPVVADSPTGPQPLALEGELEAGRPPGATPGTYQVFPFVNQSPPLPLVPGRYEWRLTAGEDSAIYEFEVRARQA